MLSSLVVASLVDDADLVDPGRDPRVHRQSLLLFRRPATGVSAQSLSSSEEDESRFSPTRGAFGRGELSSDEKDVLDVSDCIARGKAVALGVVLEAALALTEWSTADASVSLGSVDAVVAIDVSVELEEARSECASVYLTVLISSSSGVRNETRFSAGNMGRAGAILRGIIDLAGLLARIEARLCGCLYGIEMVADSLEADVRVEESVDAELGVEALFAFEKLLSIESRGFEGRSRAGAVDGCS